MAVVKPVFDFRHLNCALHRANKALPVLYPFATLIDNDKHVYSQRLKRPLLQHEGACWRVQGHTNFLCVCYPVALHHRN